MFGKAPRFWLSALALVLLSGCGWKATSSSTIGVASFTDENAASTIGIGNAQTTGESLKGNALAQSFQLSSAETISRVSVKLAISGTASTIAGHTLTLTLEKNPTGGSYPSGSAFDANASSQILISALSTSAQYIAFIFPASVRLEKDTPYWIKVKASYPAPSSSFVTWAGFSGDATSGYSLGSALYLTQLETWSNSLIGAYTDLTFIVE